MKRGSLFLLAVLLPATLIAGELEGVTMPDTITVEGKDLVLNGLGLREASFLKVDGYVAGKNMGTIEGEDFARALWSVWFGPEPPNEGLKEGMLGN